MATGETQIDTGSLRVTRWDIEPGGAIPLHRHEHEYVVVPLVDATLHVVDADGSEAAVELRVGRSYARPAGAHHTVANRGSAPLAFVEIERLS